MSETTNVGSVFAAELNKENDSLKPLQGTTETKAAGEFVLKAWNLRRKRASGMSQKYGTKRP